MKKIKSKNNFFIWRTSRAARTRRGLLGMSAKVFLIPIVAIGSFFILYKSAVADYQGDVATDGAVSHWDFSESSGNVIDRIGTVDGTVVGTPARGVVGPVGAAYSFSSAAEQGVDLPDGVYNSQTEGAIEAVFKINNTTGDKVLFAQGDSGTGGGNQIVLEVENDHIQFMARTPSTKFQVKMNGATTLTAGTWYHVAVTVDTTGTHIYLNGAEDTPYDIPSGSSASTYWFDQSSANATTARYSIGYLDRASKVGYFDGTIDEVAEYGSVPDPSVWAQHYNDAFGTAANNISLTSPVSYQMFQRDDQNQADIVVKGDYSGSPTAIEAQWNGGDWTTIDSSPSGGSFSGVLPNEPVGEGTVNVRFANDTSVAQSASSVAIGDVFVIAGQSNASGRGSNNQTYSTTNYKAHIFTNADQWAELTDPTDSAAGQVDSVSYDGGAGGSVWPLIATHFLASEDVPIGFIPTAKGGEPISEFARDDAEPGNTSTLYGSMYRRIQAVGGVKAVLFWQGGTDAQNGTTYDAYKTALQQYADNVYEDFGVSTIVSSIQDQNTDSRPSYDDVRRAQQDAFGTHHIIAGPIIYDIALGDVHLRTDAQLQTDANRWWAAIDAGLYSPESDGRGPKIASATYDGNLAIDLVFTDDSLPLLPANDLSGFRVKDDGTQVAISAATRVASDTIRLTLASKPAGTITVSLGEDRDGAGAAVPTDSSAYHLPAEMFVDYPVTTTESSDTVAPTGTITINNGDATTDSSDISLSLGATDNVDDAADITMRVANDASFTGSSWEPFVATKAWSLEGSDGTKTVYIQFRDSAGNISTTYSDTIDLETSEPDTEGPVITFDGTPDALTNQKNATFTFSATDVSNPITYECEIDGASYTSCTSPVSYTDIEDGSHTVKIRATDHLGNTRSKAYTWVVDTHAPVIVLSGNATETITQGQVYTDAGATASDDHDGDISSNIQVSGLPDTDTPGTYTVRYNVDDAAGNHASQVTRVVDVVENTDSNGDGTPDAEQQNVWFGVSSVSHKRVGLEVASACTIDSAAIYAESSNATQDTTHDYPNGLLGFTAACGTPGYSTTVTQYYYNVTDTNGLTVRAYNSTTQTYKGVVGAVVSHVTLNGQPVTKITYSVTDGSDLDIDGTANGTITDPVGLARGATDDSTGNQNSGNNSSNNGESNSEGGVLAATGDSFLIIAAGAAVTLLVAIGVIASIFVRAHRLSARSK